MDAEFYFDELPEPALCLIASYLSIPDLRNFRLTCTKAYTVSFYREVLRNMQINAKKIDENNMETFISFLSKTQHGKFTAISITQTHFGKAYVETMAVNICYVTNLSLDMIYTEEIVRHCPHVKKLTWINSFQNKDREKDDIILKQCDYLDNFVNLEELIVEGSDDYFDYPRFPARLIHRLNNNSQKIQTLVFHRVLFTNDQSVESGYLTVRNTTIKNWKFHHVYMIGEFFIKVPNKLTSLECFYAEDIQWEQYNCSLKSLGVDSDSVPKEWNFMNYKTLENLKLHSIRFLSMFPPICKNVKTVTLRDCINSIAYLKVLSSFNDNVKELTLESEGSAYMCDSEIITDYQVVEIVNDIMQDLHTLRLTNLNSVSPRFLGKLRSETLQSIIINNCVLFENKIIERDYTFRVVVKYR